MMRLGIATKIVLSFCGILFAFSLVMMLGIWQTQALFGRVQTVNRSIVPLSLMLSDAQNELKGFASSLDAAALSSPPLAPLERILGKLDRARSLARRTQFDGVEEGPVATRLGRTQARLDTLIAQALELEQSTRALENLPQAASLQAHAEHTAPLRQEAAMLEAQLGRLKNDLRIATDLTLMELSRTQRRNLYVLGAMFLIALLVALGMLTIALLTVRPIRALTQGVQEVARGTYQEIPDARTKILGRDELALLTQEFNAMSRALGERDMALKAQHDALLKSERLATVGRMTSLITHELRNPLSSIGLNAEMLMESLLHPPTAAAPLPEAQQEARAQLETIIKEVDRLRDITQEYLTYARLPEPRFAQEDVVDLIQSLIDFHTWEWQHQGVTVAFEPPFDSLVMQLDANQMRQALLNLIKNGVEALHDHPQGRIVVSLWTEQSQAFLRIKDNGQGIPSADGQRIFEPFFSSKSKGTGLGLAMTQQIVATHQGSLTLEVHDPPALGASFLITLPLQKSTPAP